MRKITYSTDYDLLWELLMEGNKIPVNVTYNGLLGEKYTDICTIVKSEYNTESKFYVQSGGILRIILDCKKKEFKK